MNTQDIETVNRLRNRIVEYLADIDGSYGTNEHTNTLKHPKRQRSAIKAHVVGTPERERENNLFTIAMTNAIGAGYVKQSWTSNPYEYYITPEGVAKANKIIADRAKDALKRENRSKLAASAAQSRAIKEAMTKTYGGTVGNLFGWRLNDPSYRPNADWAKVAEGINNIPPVGTIRRRQVDDRIVEVLQVPVEDTAEVKKAIAEIAAKRKAATQAQSLAAAEAERDEAFRAWRLAADKVVAARTSSFKNVSTY